MPMDRLTNALATHVESLDARGTAKGAETVFTGIVAPHEGRGPRYTIAGHPGRSFLRMNSNGYLGMALRKEVLAAEEAAVRTYGTGPGAVRFISGTWGPHVALEARLAAFHARDAAMIFSSAYATTMGVLPSLVTPETAIVSDELNHNCIINAIRLSRPAHKAIYHHNSVEELDQRLREARGVARRAIVVTDGIFSMRGDSAPLREIAAVVREHDASFPENAVLMVDDSHGVGAFGPTGRGTEEHEGMVGGVDILVATLGKAFGVNGGYVVGSSTLIRYLRETAPLYIYSNPITAAEAAAALAALDLVDSRAGMALLEHLRAMTQRFEDGLVKLGYETIPGGHPVVPLMVRDTPRNRALVAHLFAHGILATGLNFPVVPQGDEEIRFQISAEHTEADIDEALSVLTMFPNR